MTVDKKTRTYNQGDGAQPFDLPHFADEGGTYAPLVRAGFTKAVVATPALDTAAYAANDNMGGKLSFASVTRIAAGAGFIASVVLVDQDNEKGACDLVLFGADPSGTTFTNNAAMDIADADMAKIVGVVNFVAADYVSFADNAIAFKQTAISFTLAAGTTLYGALVSRDSKTYTAANDIVITLSVLVD
jgi:hypothetical protein